MREAVLRGLLEGAPTAACLVGADGGIRDCNPAFAVLFGFPDTEQARAGRRDTLIADEAAWRLAAGTAAGGSMPPRFETAGRSMDGRSLQLLCDMRPLGDPGDPAGSVAWLTDVTERRRMEQELAQAPRTRTGSRIVRGIGHDLGNMLTVVRGFAEVLARELPEGSRGRGWLAQINTATDRAAALGEELLAAARPPDPRVEDLSPAAVLEGCIALVRRVAGSGAATELRAAAGDRRIRADRNQVEDMVLGLVAMARGARPADARLTIEVVEAAMDARESPAGVQADIVLRVSTTDRAWELHLPSEAPQG